MTNDELEGLLGLVRLAGQPHPEAWVADWLEMPHAKLDGRRPKDSFTNRSARLYVYAIAAVEADFSLLDSLARSTSSLVAPDVGK